MRKPLPVVSLTMLIVCSIVSILGSPKILWLWPICSPEFRPWQLVTYAFAHGGFLHLVMNLVAIISFAPYIERKWGSINMLLFTLAAIVFAGHLQIHYSKVPVIGASGLIFGIFVAYAWMRPNARLVTLFGWNVRAWAAVAVYIGLTVIAILFDIAPGVAHLAHLGGAVIGAMSVFAFKR